MTLKGKIMGIIVLTLIIFNFGLTFFIYNTLYSSLKDNIKNDLENIRKFSVNTLKYSALVIDDNSKVKNKTISEVNNNYNCYIGLYDYNNIKIDSKGDFFSEESINNILKNSNNKSSVIGFNNKNGLISTYVYPVYLSGNYDSTLILQKSYYNEYNAILSTMYDIALVQVILLIIIVIVLNYFINKIINPLRLLSKRMEKYGEGRDVEKLKVSSHDEVGQVTQSFNDMIEEKKKLENISKDFFNNATHELKTPVTSIYGYVQILGEEDFNKIDEEFRKRAFNRISMECCKLRDLIQKLLEISRGGVRKTDLKQEFRLDELIDTICDRLMDRVNRLNKKFIINMETIKIVAIKEDIEQIILNLIDNSLKYSKGNDIIISLKEVNDKFIFKIENKIGNIPDNISKNLLDPLEYKKRDDRWCNKDGNWYFNFEGTYTDEGRDEDEWDFINGYWYHFNKDGIMDRNITIKDEKGNDCVLNSDGVLTNREDPEFDDDYYDLKEHCSLKVIDGNSYFIDGYGKKITGWVMSGDKWYYMDSNGVMQKNKTIIEGSNKYVLGADGAWIK